MAWIHYREMQLSVVQRAQWMVEHHMGAHTTISGQRRLRAIVETRDVGYYWIVEWIF